MLTTAVAITSSALITLGIEGQVKCTAFWDMVMCALFYTNVVHILANVVDHLGICILHTVYIKQK